MASWTDKEAIRTTLQLRDEFKIKHFIETGTYKGTNTELYSNKFQIVSSCELVPVYCDIAKERLKDKKNVYIFNSTSQAFLRKIRKLVSKDEIVFIYLDAHFYNKDLPKRDRFVVLKELRALRDFPNCIICIHDFDNGKFGHITYDDIPLNLELMKFELKRVNPKFKFYTNTECDIIKSGSEIGLKDDEEMKSTLEFIWSKPEKTYRGILYCIPREVNLNKYKLRKIR